MTTTDAAAAVAARYKRFARDEAPGRSPLYADWAAGAASDAAVCAVLAGIPAEHRQPPLVFAVTRLLGAPEEPYPRWRQWLLDHAQLVAAECRRRTLQTNEPQRCAALLPALGLIDGPIALLEVGASAGLCLYPDRYSYRYVCENGAVLALDPADGVSGVVLSAQLRGEGRPMLRMPEVVWRAGIDLHPLDAGDPDDRAWLTGLVWPGEQGRIERIEAALDIAAAHPPVLTSGDAAQVLGAAAGAVAAEAPAEATLVVTTPGVLAHVAREARNRLIAEARAAGRWITLDHPDLHSAFHSARHPPLARGDWPADSFMLALDGRVLAAVDPLGGFVEWRPGESVERR